MPDRSAVLSNTSPLYYLHSIGRLDLLHSLYGTLVVTEHVVSELEAGGADALGIRSLDWVSIRPIQVPEMLRLVPDLGLGEASTIALAIQLGPTTLVVLDDSLGRRIARLNTVRVTGTAGVLLRAKERGLVPEIRPLLKDLVSAGFYLKAQHFEDICQMAGER